MGTIIIQNRQFQKSETTENHHASHPPERVSPFFYHHQYVCTPCHPSLRTFVAASMRVSSFSSSLVAVPRSLNTSSRRLIWDFLDVCNALLTATSSFHCSLATARWISPSGVLLYLLLLLRCCFCPLSRVIVANTQYRHDSKMNPF